MSANAAAGPCSRRCLCVELPVMDYGRALALQHLMVAARRRKILADDAILLLEHPPVFTLGRRGGRENLTVSEAFLRRSGIPIVPVERGGNITFHGPGQLVGYPVLDLPARRLGVIDYVGALEEAMIRAARDFGVAAGRNSLNRGIWVGRCKLGSIGIALRRGITFHGFAFNVNLALEPFAWINPCGLHDVGVTSLARERGRRVSMERVRQRMRHHLSRVLGLRLVALSPAQLERLVDPQRAVGGLA